MSLFRKKQSLVDEFLSVYGHIHQYMSWVNGRIPSAFREGIREDAMQHEVLEWARRNSVVLDQLKKAREDIFSHSTNSGQTKTLIDDANKILAEIELRLKKLGRQN